MQNLKFGTGGIRAIMGIGLDKINKFTISSITLGLCNYLKKKINNNLIKIAIAYDVRENSNIYAYIAANIFSSQGIKVFYFSKFRPTPVLSYTIIKMQCQYGIMITASHNPPEYNGYKIYREDGSQITSPEDELIMNEINNINMNNINFLFNHKMITHIGKEIDYFFIKDCIKYTSFKKEGRNMLKIVFSSLHGTTISIMPKAFKKAGFKKIYIVKEQAKPDSKFSTVESPNPEESNSFLISLQKAQIYKSDIVLLADPDGDRMGLAIRDNKNNMILLNGNQINTILIYYLLKQYKNKNILNHQSFIISTVVSSDIFIKIAKIYNIQCKLSLTGFKWISKIIRDSNSEKNFICGGEESLGFMLGNFIRDKNSITSMLLISEIAAISKYYGSSIYEELLKIYLKTGCYQEKLISHIYNKKNNFCYKNIFIKYRNFPPQKIDGSKVIYIEDYYTGIKKNLLSGKEDKLLFPKSNILIYRTYDGTKIAIRISGTEPKIKFYISVNKYLSKINDYFYVNKFLKNKIKNIINDIFVYLKI